MGLKEVLKQTFSDKNSITIERYKAAKFAFIISSFLFFINFYSVGAKFYLNFFSHTLGIMYIILLLSLLFFTYFFIKKLLIGKVQSYFFILILVVLFLIFGFLLLPFIVKGGFNGILDLVLIYS